VQFQERVKKVTGSKPYQFAVVLAIVGNFLCNIIEAQMNPIAEGSQVYQNFQTVDLCFIIIFSIELIFNMTAHWFWEFWSDKANWADAFIVLVSVVGLFTEGGSSAYTVIRIMRVFRVVRVSNRLASVRLIIKALGSAVVPVSNAFFIMLVATSIWAILGVSLFDKRSPEHFGNFGASFFTVVAACPRICNCVRSKRRIQCQVRSLHSCLLTLVCVVYRCSSA
jgi:voltage-gated sodium channel